MGITLPRRAMGRQSAAAIECYEQEVEEFCAAIMGIQATLDFDISARGWCYILEEHGLGKGDFDRAQALMVACRKSGDLPIDIVAEDAGRQFSNLETVDDPDTDVQAQHIVDIVKHAHLSYTPESFWHDQDYYVEMLVEKIDLRTLFNPICERFHIPIANARGWSDLHSRYAMMQRFEEHENDGRQCVLLYCGDHDPVGLAISDFLRSNMNELADAAEWFADDLIIDRFGLNADFIEDQGLSWIDGLETGSGKRLEDPRHKDHRKPHVQRYLQKFGARKCEANALVVRPEAGRQLCLDAVLKYVDEDAPDEFQVQMRPHRADFAAKVKARMENWA